VIRDREDGINRRGRGGRGEEKRREKEREKEGEEAGIRGFGRRG
jgi:hypothetical protein